MLVITLHVGEPVRIVTASGETVWIMLGVNQSAGGVRLAFAADRSTRINRNGTLPPEERYEAVVERR